MSEAAIQFQVSEREPVGSPALVQALGQADLLAFTHLTHPDYHANWHHEEIARKLQDLESGKIKRLMVFAPPRSGKSELCSIHFPIWAVGRNPTWPVILAAHTDGLAEEFGMGARDLAGLSRELGIFPDMEIRRDTNAKGRWSTRAGANLVFTGMGGPMTGRGAMILIIEDPLKNADEARSQAVKRGQFEWYLTTAKTRLEKDGRILVVMTRWAEDDLAGMILANEPGEWTVLKFPMFDVAGKILWDWKYPQAQWERERKTANSFASGRQAFAGIYQQEPHAPEGGLLPISSWQFAKNIKPKRVYQSWDTGNKDGAGNDPSACGTWYETKNGFHLADLWVGQVEFPQLVAMFQAQYAKHHPRAVLVEDKSSGISLIQQMRRETRIPIIPINPTTDKESRSDVLQLWQAAGRISLEEGAPWLADFINECVAFPNGPHDDRVDQATQFVNWMFKREGKKGIGDYWVPGM